MRALRFFFIVTLVTLSTSIFAAGKALTSKTVSKQHNAIVNKLNKHFNNSDYHSILDKKEYNNVIVYFSISDNNVISPYLVVGGNRALNNFVENELISKPIEVTSANKNQNYKIKLVFK